MKTHRKLQNSHFCVSTAVLSVSVVLLLGMGRQAAALTIKVIDQGVSGHPKVIAARNHLIALGHTLTTGSTLADYSAFDQVWDLRYNASLGAADITAMGNYLAASGRMYLTGEHSGFDSSRNTSLVSWTSSVGGGSLILASSLSGSQPITAAGQIVNSPNIFTNLSYSAARTTSSAGTGFLVTETSLGSGEGSLVGWDFGDISGKPGARMLIGFDIEIFQNGQNWTENMATYLEPGPPCPLRVEPLEDFISDGNEGGPFTPPSKDYTLTNSGPNSLIWEASTTCFWLDLYPSDGNLPAGANTTVTVSVNALANNLEAGIYGGEIVFRDLTSDCNLVRDATLEVLLEPILEVTIPDTARVVDHDDGTYVVGTDGGDLYVINEEGEYTVTALGAGFIYDVRIEYPFIAVAAGTTVIELALAYLTPVELWRSNVGYSMRSVDLSEDGGSVAYLSYRQVGVIQNGNVVASYYLPSGYSTNWLDATADMQYIAITDEPCPPGPGGTQTGVELYEFDGSSLIRQWGVVLMTNYETIEVRISDAKDYVAAATSSGTFMKALDITDGSVLWEYETPGKEQFTCDGDDNLNYVIGATRAWSSPYPWFILRNLGESGYEVLAEGEMDDRIDDIDSNPDASLLAFGSDGGEFILLSRSDDTVETILEGDERALIDAIEIGGISLLVGGDGFINLYPFRKVAVDIDIKPQSCPNPLSVRSKGILPVAILGSEEFDVNTIDSVSLRLADVAPIRSSYEDVAGPVLDANDCNCTTDGPDGYIDLTLKFRTREIVEQLIDMPGGLVDGEVLALTLTGVLSDETPIEGADCVVLVGNVLKWLEAKRWDGNEDGVVNLLDLAMMTENWLQSTVVED